ncbi:MAG: hypothetical protein LUD69_04750 [Oscillospiraceae bacterium]|nr:hypothetical protein [Oscillospiraceae bacterium]
MDDVLWGLLSEWVRYLNAAHGLSVKAEYITEWNMSKAYPTLTQEEIARPLMTRELWESVKPLPGAQDGLRSLMDAGHDVYCLSASSHLTIAQKVEYAMKRLYPFVPENHLVFTHKKCLVHGDVLIDDYPPNLAGGYYKGILMDAPYNRSFSARKYGVLRVHGWSELSEDLLYHFTGIRRW